MIHADDVMPLLVAAVPSFAEQWQALQRDPIHTDEDDGTRLHYVDAGFWSGRVSTVVAAEDDR